MRRTGMTRVRLARWGLACAAVLAVAAAACGSAGPCKDDYDCDGTEVCNVTAGQCESPVCRHDVDCIDSRLVCRDNRCIQK